MRTAAASMADMGGLGSDVTYLETSTAPDINRLLASKYTQEKLHGMKSLLGMELLGRDVTPFFADVVKNVTVSNVEVKKLVYMYLVQHASEQPDLALLSVNSFQRDLADPSALIRAMALRVMAAIRVPLIRPLVMMAVQKCATDSSPHVRKTAAHALPNLLTRASDAADDAEADDAEGADGGEIGRASCRERV